MALTRPKKVPTANLSGLIGSNLISAIDSSLITSSGALTGSVRKIYYNKTDVEVSTTSTAYQNAVTVTVPMDTTLYNYYVLYVTPYMKDGAATGNAVDLAITVDGAVHAENGHRGHSVASNAYLSASNTAYITTSYTGGTNRTIAGCICAYTAGTVNNHDNHANSGASITVFELYK